MALIDETLAPFEKDLAKISKIIEAQLLALLSEYDSVGGKILNNNVNMKMTLGFSKSFENILVDSGYNDMAKDFAESNSDVINKLQKLSVGTTIPLSFTKTDMATFNTLSKLNFDDLFRIGKDASDVLLTDLRASILTGQRLKTVKADLIKKLDNNLKRYADTYMTTARNQLMQQAEILGVGDADVIWEYVGPSDSKNRQECAYALEKRYFTKEEMDSFNENYGMRWNCRHVFMAVLIKDIKN